MARRKNNASFYSRTYRPRSQRSLGRPRRRPFRLADPHFYLSAVLVTSAVALVVLPGVADAFLAVTRPASSAEGTCRIYRIVDGDTARMFCTGEGDVSARLVGFDTPELFSPSCPSELAAAVKAKWALRLAIWNADEVSLMREGTDRYGRALVRVSVDGQPLADRMIKDGHARAYQGGLRSGWCA